MYAVIERDSDGKEKLVKRTSDFIAAHDFAESLNEDMDDNGYDYLVRKID